MKSLDGKDKRKYFKVGDLVKIVFKSSRGYGEVAKVRCVTEDRVFLENGRGLGWGHVSSLLLVKLAEEIWSIS